jgi:hypothetical protein
MGLTRNQTAVLTVLARDEKLKIEREQQWVGRTLGSLVNDVSRVMGPSSAYAAVQSLERIGFVSQSFRRGQATNNQVLRFVSITHDGMIALEQENILISELAEPEPVPLAADETGATMGDAAEKA